MDKCEHCSKPGVSLFHPDGKCPYEAEISKTPNVVRATTLNMTKILDYHWNRFEAIPKVIDLDKSYKY